LARVEQERRPPVADFRIGARDVREAANERGVPETREGAGPADADSPEFSRGEPNDDPQPSARRRPELESQESRTDDADARKPEESF
jgi:hypothetical protein